MLIIKKIETPAELISAQKVRFQVFCEELGVLDRQAFPDGLVTDKYDQRSIHFAAIVRGNIVGTLRLIEYQESSGFPIEDNVELPAEFSRLQSVEISRGAVLKEHRNMLGVTLKGIDMAYEHCKASSIKHIFAFANYDMYLLYKKMRVPFEYIGPTRIYNNFKTVPLVFAVNDDYRIPHGRTAN